MGIVLDMPKSELRHLVFGASIHDIGKILIPEAVMNVARSLSKSEFEIVKRHTSLGHLIVSTLQYHPIVQDVALHHHERLDGKGYPEGLKGGQVSIHARIISIVDVYDALISDRTYRKAYKPSEAVDIMLDMNVFDKKLLKIFLNKVLK